MSLQQIDSHYLLPWSPDWGTTPEMEIQYDTEKEIGIQAQEERAQMRAGGTAKFTYICSLFYDSLDSNDRTNTNNLEDELTTSRKTGLATCPIWDRPTYLLVVALTLDTDITINRDGAWGFEVNDYVFLKNSQGQYEVKQILIINNSVIEFTSALDNDYDLDSQIFPLLFGVPEFSSIGVTGWLSDFIISITSDNFDFKFFKGGIEEDFQSYQDGPITSFSSNSCIYSGSIIEIDDGVSEDFQSYQDGSITLLNRGTSFGSGVWKARGTFISV